MIPDLREELIHVKAVYGKIICNLACLNVHPSTVIPDLRGQEFEKFLWFGMSELNVSEHVIPFTALSFC